MANVGCRIRKEFERPDRKLIEAFKDIPVANIDDCMNRTAAVDSQLKPMNKARLLGTAFTVKAPAASVTVPEPVELLATVTPTIGSPVARSVTRPVTSRSCDWASAACEVSCTGVSAA